MSLLRVSLIATVLLCTGCQTVIIRPASAPICEIPAEFQNACIETAKLSDELTYGDLPNLALSARNDYVECRKTYQKVMKSYDICSSGLTKFNQSLKNLEDQMKGKYKDAKVIQQD